MRVTPRFGAIHQRATLFFHADLFSYMNGMSRNDGPYVKSFSIRYKAGTLCTVEVVMIVAQRGPVCRCNDKETSLKQY